jgi:hypothetical protein
MSQCIESHMMLVEHVTHHFLSVQTLVAEAVEAAQLQRLTEAAGAATTRLSSSSFCL